MRTTRFSLDFLGCKGSRYLSQSSPGIGIDWNDRYIFFDFLRTISPRRCETECEQKTKSGNPILLESDKILPVDVAGSNYWNLQTV